MGILGLWDVLGEGDTVPLGRLATNFLREKGRPLRIAVDEANWRFRNLNKYQVDLIKEKEPAANPIEKAIFYRIAGLLQLNIQLLFVFDGPSRPWKRGRKGGNRVDYASLKEVKKLLEFLAIPYHEAPAEAEAECARLQQEGIVDAVWTDDGDAFMFGTTMLIRSHYEKKAKSKTHVKVYYASNILEKHGLDKNGFILCAVVAGGDYDTHGLVGCGANIAIRLAKKGLGDSLCSSALSAVEMHAWRKQMEHALRGNTAIPKDFPNPLALKHYMNPKVSTTEQLQNLRCLRDGWDRPMDEKRLRPYLRTRYNLQIKAYLKHIVPILLTRTLAATPGGQARTNNIYGIELPKRQKKKDDEFSEMLQRKITFLPQPVTTLDLNHAPDGEAGEDWKDLKGANGEPFDAKAPIDCKVLEYVLQRGVPHVLMAVEEAANAPKPPKKATARVQTNTAQSENAQPKPAKRKRKVTADADGEDEEVNADEPSSKPPAKMARKSKQAMPLTQPEATGESVTSVRETVTSARPRPVFRTPPTFDFSIFQDIDEVAPILTPAPSSSLAPKCSLGRASSLATSSPAPAPLMAPVIVNLDDDDDDDEIGPVVQVVPAKLLYPQPKHTSTTRSLLETIRLEANPLAEELRRKRLAHFSNSSTPTANPTISKIAPSSSTPMVIDLTLD